MKDGYRIKIERVEDGEVEECYTSQISELDADLSTTLGCLIGIAINAMCNCDEPYVEGVLCNAINRSNTMSTLLRGAAEAYELPDIATDEEAYAVVVDRNVLFKETKLHYVIAVDELPQREGGE